MRLKHVLIVVALLAVVTHPVESAEAVRDAFDSASTFLESL